MGTCIMKLSSKPKGECEAGLCGNIWWENAVSAKNGKAGTKKSWRWAAAIMKCTFKPLLWLHVSAFKANRRTVGLWLHVFIWRKFPHVSRHASGSQKTTTWHMVRWSQVHIFTWEPRAESTPETSLVSKGTAEQMVVTEKSRQCDAQPYLYGMFSQRSRYDMIPAKISTAKETAQWLTTLDALPKDSTSIPSIHLVIHKIHPELQHPLMASTGTMCTWYRYRYIWAKQPYT